VKEQNKRLCVAAEQTKEATAKSKNDLEGAYTALQNLLYEKVWPLSHGLTCHIWSNAYPDCFPGNLFTRETTGKRSAKLFLQGNL
jgi:hypothetical protein